MKTLVELGYMPIADAVRKCTGCEPHIQTVRRWVKKGVRGYRLDCKFVNGRYMTTLEDVNKFISNVGDARLAELRSES